jgi:hypothetical protein
MAVGPCCCLHGIAAGPCSCGAATAGRLAVLAALAARALLGWRAPAAWPHHLRRFSAPPPPPPPQDIPDGDWFCPACMAQHNQGQPKPPQQRRGAGEMHGILDGGGGGGSRARSPGMRHVMGLLRLARRLSSSGHGELSVAERCELLVCLCDLAAGSASARAHLAECEERRREARREIAAVRARLRKGARKGALRCRRPRLARRPGAAPSSGGGMRRGGLPCAGACEGACMCVCGGGEGRVERSGCRRRCCPATLAGRHRAVAPPGAGRAPAAGPLPSPPPARPLAGEKEVASAAAAAPEDKEVKTRSRGPAGDASRDAERLPLLEVEVSGRPCARGGCSPPAAKGAGRLGCARGRRPGSHPPLAAWGAGGGAMWALCC